MIYIDTSALVPAFIREPKSEAVLAWIETSGERLVVSEWAIAEFSSAAAIKVPQRAEFRRAAELAGDADLKLRAGDALHLAIAEAGKVQGILCLDETMGASAKMIGLNVVSV